MATLEENKEIGQLDGGLTALLASARKPALIFCAIALVVAAHLVTAQRSHPVVGALLFLAGVVILLSPPLRKGMAQLGECAGKAVDRAPFIPLISGFRLRLALLANCVALALVAFSLFGGNRLDKGFWFWAAGIAYYLLALAEKPEQGWRNVLQRWRQRLSRRVVLVAVVILAVAAFFRLFRLATVPIDMTSDHAEKLLDVYDVLTGARPIFFTRNTGREAFQFYLTAGLVRWTPLEVSHLALKVGTALFGLLTVPATYLLGKELYGRRVGAIAAFLFAISFWHVAISRVGLRFPFTAAFATPALYFLLRAVRQNRRNDWLAAGMLLGLGLHTYTAMRIVPLLFILVVALHVAGDVAQLLRARRAGGDGLELRPVTLQRSFWENAVVGLGGALLLFLPLLRYMSEAPDNFWFRAASRAQEAMPPAEVWATFWLNVKNALLMFNYRGDVVPMNTVPESPVLDPITGGLFVLGAAILLWRLFARRKMDAAITLSSLFVFLLPSILSLAFPEENPSVVRSGGAIPLVMIMAALPLAMLATEIRRTVGWQRRLGWLLGLVLLLGALVSNYNWYFHSYDENIRRSIWNATEMGAELRAFENRGGDLDNAYHIAYPHWVDTRNIGINAGRVTWHNAVTDLGQIAAHAEMPGAKLYLLFPVDEAALKVLRELYPQGILRLHVTERPGKQFLVFEVPGS